MAYLAWIVKMMNGRQRRQRRVERQKARVRRRAQSTGRLWRAPRITRRAGPEGNKLLDWVRPRRWD